MRLREQAAEAQATLREFVENGAGGGAGPDGGHEPLPDVDASDIAADLGVPVHVAWSHVMADVQWVPKGTSKGLNYSYRGIDAVMNRVGPALRKHGVVVLPIKVEPEYSTVNAKSGSALTFCRATVTFAILGPRGDRMPVDVVTVGEAFDTGDKSSTKAQTVALRTMFINALAIPVDRPEMDPEHGPQHELAAPKPPTPDEYAEEIQRSTTTMERLRWLRRQFADHPEEASATVELLGGERITLGDLLTRVGRARQEGR